MRASDHALAVVKAAVNLVPVVGGAIASLISDYIPSATQRSVDHAMVLLGERLKRMEDRIDPDAINRDEFAELFKSCYLIFVRTHHEEKLRAAAEIIANAVLRPGDAAKLPYEELDHLVRCVDSLSIGALSLLGIIRQLTMQPQTNNRADFQYVSARFPEVEVSLLMSLATALNSMNLIHITEPAIKTQNYGNYSIEITPIGLRFQERFLSSNS